jgi:hypothetical protein
MLQHATGTNAEMRATRLNAIGRALQYLDGLAFIEVAVSAGLAHTHSLARQCASDEHGLAFEPADAAPVVEQVGDVEVEFVLG